MKTLVIRIEIEIPDNVAVTVGSGGTSGLSPAAPIMGGAALGAVPALPDEPPWPDMTPAALEAFPDALVANPESVLHDTPHVAIVPAGSCPIHGPDHWVVSKFGGFYCTAKDDSKPKGYCVLKTGIKYRGVVIP